MISAEGGVTIGIDASNIRAGGGLTHLAEILRAARPGECGVRRVVIWGGRDTLATLPARPWLDCIHDPMLDGPLVARFIWQYTRLSRLVRASCDLLFVPGGTYLGGFRPYVAMAQNMLPFMPAESKRYGLSKTRLRLKYLRLAQTRTLRKATGVIFLTPYAVRQIEGFLGGIPGLTRVVPHGLEERFRLRPRPQRPISTYSEAHPFCLLYVSIVDEYKHQWRVAEAVSRLRQTLPVAVDIVGPAYGPSLKRLRSVFARCDPEGRYLRYRGEMAFADIHTAYHQADAYVFASTCEMLPNTLAEAMAAGLPIACSNQPPMSEMLGDGAEFFSPADARDIAGALERMIRSPERREHLAQGAYARAQAYSWDRCAGETFSFLGQIANRAAEPSRAARGACLRAR